MSEIWTVGALLMIILAVIAAVAAISCMKQVAHKAREDDYDWDV